MGRKVRAGRGKEVGEQENSGRGGYRRRVSERRRGSSVEEQREKGEYEKRKEERKQG